MTNLPILYKLDSKDKVREWRTWVDDKDCPGKFITRIRHGLQVGQQQDERITFNTLDEAEKECQSRHDYMVNRRGYTEKIPVQRPVKCMLAHVYLEHSDKVPDLVYLQPKLDGLRCLASKTWLRSRDGIYYRQLPHISHALAHLPDDVILDGELYVHDKPFQEMSSIIKRDLPHPNYHEMQYHVYDIVDQQLPFTERKDALVDIHYELKQGYIDNEFVDPLTNKQIPFPIHRVETVFDGKLQIDAYLQRCVERGYEGCMIRNPMGLYECDLRSYTLMKHKPKQVTTLPICGFKHGKGRAEKHAIAVLRVSADVTCDSVFAMPDYMKKHILKNQKDFLGKYVTVEFFEYTDDGSLRHPRITGFV